MTKCNNLSDWALKG